MSGMPKAVASMDASQVEKFLEKLTYVDLEGDCDLAVWIDLVMELNACIKQFDNAPRDRGEIAMDAITERWIEEDVVNVLSAFVPVPATQAFTLSERMSRDTIKSAMSVVIPKEYIDYYYSKAYSKAMHDAL